MRKIKVEYMEERDVFDDIEKFVQKQREIDPSYTRSQVLRKLTRIFTGREKI